ncbi:MAG TPA: DUF1684 domain-containing protein [Candidatus Limnocylindrales bacterium]
MADNDPSAALVRAIEAERAAKDEAFRHSPASPIPDEDREAFGGLAYFPVDPACRLSGLSLSPYEGTEAEAFHMPTSTDELRRAWRAGTFRFELAGQPLSLVAYDLGNGALFVPFLDATSGSETYGAGRYLDVEPEPDGTYTLDFNLAYFPYCAYSPYYSCPLTPAENRLPVRVEAGERLQPA